MKTRKKTWKHQRCSHYAINEEDLPCWTCKSAIHSSNPLKHMWSDGNGVQQWTKDFVSFCFILFFQNIVLAQGHPLGCYQMIVVLCYDTCLSAYGEYLPQQLPFPSHLPNPPVSTYLCFPAIFPSSTPPTLIPPEQRPASVCNGSVQSNFSTFVTKACKAYLVAPSSM